MYCKIWKYNNMLCNLIQCYTMIYYVTILHTMLYTMLQCYNITLSSYNLRKYRGNLRKCCIQWYNTMLCNTWLTICGKVLERIRCTSIVCFSLILIASFNIYFLLFVSKNDYELLSEFSRVEEDRLINYNKKQVSRLFKEFSITQCKRQLQKQRLLQ